MKQRNWVQDMKSGFAAASIGPARPTSADESLLLQRAVDAAVQKALDGQRERIAAAIDNMGCTMRTGWYDCVGDKHYTRCPIAIAAAIRSGEIVGEQK